MNKYRTQLCTGISGLQASVNGLTSDDKIIKIVQEIGGQQGSETYTYKQPDMFLLITENTRAFE